MKERIFFFDTYKFILIFLVVFGHLLPPYREESFNSELYSWIFLFHMPLFIIISGAFSKKKENLKAFKLELLKLLEFLIASTIMSLAIVSIIPHRDLYFITKEGRFTLFYYFWHLLIVFLLLSLITFAKIEMNSIVLFAMSILVLAILYFMIKFKVFPLLMNPVTSIILKKE